MEIVKVVTISIRCSICGKPLDYYHDGLQNKVDAPTMIDPHVCESGVYYDDFGNKHFTKDLV